MPGTQSGLCCSAGQSVRGAAPPEPGMVERFFLRNIYTLHQATGPLLLTNTALRDSVLLVLRKSMFCRDVAGRVAAVKGFHAILCHFKVCQYPRWGCLLLPLPERVSRGDSGLV